MKPKKNLEDMLEENAKEIKSHVDDTVKFLRENEKYLEANTVELLCDALDVYVTRFKAMKAIVEGWSS